MPTAREIQRRINSVQNIGQVTHALEAVSASAVRRAQNAATSSRPYAQYAYDVLVNVAAQSRGTPLHPLLEVRPDPKRVAVVLITGDRGLAGAYNTNIVRRAISFVEQYEHPVHTPPPPPAGPPPWPPKPRTPPTGGRGPPTAATWCGAGLRGSRPSVTRPRF